MKSNLKYLLSSLVCLTFLSFQIHAQNTPDSTGFAGDHFSLEGALSLFEEAKSLEDFEKELNTEKNYINNLDLNEDGEIDYIRVVDHQEKDLHAIVLQVAINAKEMQDLAVIEVEKTGKEAAQLQIIGDADVYGVEKIVEPFEIDSKQTGKGGPSADISIARVVVNVWLWPSVRHIYGPRYRTYVSPWGWRSYPRYWKPWRPHPWRFHHTHRVHRPHFHAVKTHRVVRAHRVYVPNRRTCQTVRTRTTVVRNRRGNVVGTKTTRTKTVRGKNGKVVAKKKNTTVRKSTKNGKVKTKRTKTVKRRKH